MFGILTTFVEKDGDIERAERVAKCEAADGTVWFAWKDASLQREPVAARGPRRAHARSGASEGDGRVMAPCAGCVTKKDVQDGQRVEADERLGVLEAMKMEFTLTCAAAGIVTWADHSDGRVVQKGVVLAQVAPVP